MHLWRELGLAHSLSQATRDVPTERRRNSSI
jgi:hypothetical protein